MADPVIGQLFPTNSPYPRAEQPNGIGSAVTDPTQPPLQSENSTGFSAGTNPTPYQEQAGRFHADCGHSFQNYEVKRAAVAGVPSAVLCCPICAFVVNIYTPYSLLDRVDVILG